MTTPLTPAGLEAIWRRSSPDSLAWRDARFLACELAQDVQALLADRERLVVEGQKDYDGMRDFQRKFIRADQDLRAAKAENAKLRAVAEAATLLVRRLPHGVNALEGLAAVWKAQTEEALAALDQQSPADEGET